MKTCTKCKVEQPLTSFHKNKSRRDGLQSQCKGCQSVAAAKYRNNNKAARAAYDAAYRADPANNLRNRATTAFNLGLRKATKYNDGVEPVISADEREMMISFLIAARELSELTGIEFEVDHIIPLSKGGLHRLSNLQCITKADNLAKWNSLDFTEYTQEPSYPRPEHIAACEAATA